MTRKRKAKRRAAKQAADEAWVASRRLLEEAARLARDAAANADPVAVTQAVAAIEACVRARRDPLDETILYLRHYFADRLCRADNMQHGLFDLHLTRLPDRPYTAIEFVFENDSHEQIVLPNEQAEQLTRNMIATLYAEVRANFLANWPAAEAARRMLEAEVQRPRDGMVRYEHTEASIVCSRTANPILEVDVVHERATEYMRRWTTPEQFAEWEQHKYFHVRGECSGRLYRIHRLQGGYNIDEVDDDGITIGRLCFLPLTPTHGHGVECGYYPMGDIMVIQKLALEYDESATLRIANRAAPLVDGTAAMPPPQANF